MSAKNNRHTSEVSTSCYMSTFINTNNI
jgi:hypothetical protein